MHFVIFLSIIFSNTIYAYTNKEISDLALKFNLIPGSKASIQWERVFSSEKRLQKHKLHTLNLEAKLKLKQYLIDHSADSDQPIVPGL